MKDRQTSEMSALRSALAAIANAEAVPVVHAGDHGQPIAGALAGLGAGEADRRLLGEQDVVDIVLDEITERLATAHLYDELGVATSASDLRLQAQVLRACLDAND